MNKFQGKREFNQARKAVAKFKEDHGMSSHIKEIIVYANQGEMLFCFGCLNDWCHHVYDFSEYMPQLQLCPSCLREVLRDDINEEEYEVGNLRKRFLIFERDGFKCVYCGRLPSTDKGVVLEIDHKYPKSKGGDDSFDNLVTACMECNRGKGDYILINRR